MSGVIALVGELQPEQALSWLKTLKAELPNEQIIEFSKLSATEKQQCEIAIVANPNPEHIAKLPNLKWLHSLWAGVEKLVANFAATELKIVRLIDPNLSHTMSEAALAWTFYLHRNMPHYRQAQNQALWQSRPYTAASDTTVGILGLGQLGLAAAQRLVANDFNVLGWSQQAKHLDNIDNLNGEQGLAQLLSQSDIVIVLLPLTENTQGLLNQERLSSMKPTAGLINFARGGIINTIDLIRQLDRKLLDHAVLDVFDQEPLAKASPLWHHPNITILPHISAQTNQVSASRIVANHIQAYRDTGQIPPYIDYKKGY